jgi:aspartate aminotransferase-like enzyme
MAKLVRSRTAAIGFGPLYPGFAKRSPTLTALRTPDGVSPKMLREKLIQRGILVAEGLGPHVAHCIRIGHMGDIRPSDIDRTCDALEAILDESR